MSSRFSTRFKKRAVEKALNNSSELTIKEVAASCGVGHSTLQRWIGDSRAPAFKQMDKAYKMASEKRPEDWSLADRLGMIIACAGLDGKALSALCRKSGLYPHHIEQWKADFLTRDISGNVSSGRKTRSSENVRLRKENKALKKELNRKDKALADPEGSAEQQNGRFAGSQKKSRCALERGGRGRLTMKEERQQIIGWIDQAHNAGARQSKACEIVGFSLRTLQRWRMSVSGQDGRIDAPHCPPNKLTDLER